MPPNHETLLDVLDLVEMQTAIHSAMAGDSARTVEADPPKKRRGRGGGGAVELTFPWFLWYGMAAGLSRRETLDSPYGELMDLIAIYQIKCEGARLRRVLNDEDIIPDVL